MNEIKCQKCNSVFKRSEENYVSIIKQVRDKEFEKEITEREKNYEKDKENAIKIAEGNIERKLKEEINKKEIELTSLKEKIKQNENDITNKLNFKYSKEISNKDIEINNLKNETKLYLEKKLNEKDNYIKKLQNKLELRENEYLIKEKNIVSIYEEKMKNKDEQIAYYKDFKAKQSTKMIGESLERHCSDEFNKLRPLFKNAYFEKDNDIKTGSKGDFIYRDYDEEKVEFVSVMFEMKNENDTTSTKHKNEDFFKELDKDRREKNCEYAVLVSLLETDSDYYNSGIVDVSHKYPKMYVIRPQFFIPFITLVRNTSLNSLEYKNELKVIKEQNIDITNFEDNINTFKEQFGRNYKLASEKFKKAIEEIDKTIDHLQKTKDALLSSENNLRLANNKAEDLTIKRLSRGNSTMSKMFEDLKNKKDENI